MQRWLPFLVISFFLLPLRLLAIALTGPGDYKIKVEVHNPQGQAVTATVTVTAEKAGTPRRRVVKAGGTTFQLPGGDTYRFEATAPGLPATSRTLRLDPVTDESVMEQSLVLVLGATRTPVTIVVLDAETGQPIREGFMVQMGTDTDEQPADSRIVTEPSITLEASSEKPFRFMVRARGYHPHEHRLADLREPRDVIVKLRKQQETVVRPYDIRVMDGDYRYVLPRCDIRVWDDQNRPVTISNDSYTGDWRVLLDEHVSYNIEVKAQGFITHRGPLTRPPQSLILVVMYRDTPKPAAVEEVRKPGIEELAVPAEEATKPAAKQDFFGRLAEKLGRSEEPDLTGKIITLNNVYFRQGSYEVLPESFPELDQLAESLKNRPTLRVEIGGHTDRLGDPKMNLFLSENRARSVYNYLVKKGIPKQRLRHTGYGFSKPVAPSDTEENRSRNRRVEVRIIGS